MNKIRNIFACLVHENQECVIDLVRNLRYVDPDSLIILYNGGQNPDLLHGSFPFEQYGAVLHPTPRPLTWGWLHNFALDCMQFALEHFPFDTMTIVDSDQLGTRAGYANYLAQFLHQRPNVGLLGNAPTVQPSYTQAGPAVTALQERDLWSPFLRRFPEGEQKFVYWSFWPSTVFTADAARDLTQLFATDQQLAEIIQRTKIWASEEVLLPTLTALLGYAVMANPCSYDYVQYRTTYTPFQVDVALDRADVFWIHPVPRRYDDDIRARIRARLNHYENAFHTSATMAISETHTHSGLLLTLPILTQMKNIEGWLEEDEADLLIAAVARALTTLPQEATVVEIGSYCGRSTVVLGGVVKSLSAEAKVYAIDPHDGVVGALDQGLQFEKPTLHTFQRNIADAALTSIIEMIPQYSFNVVWDKPIGFLLIDGLHDYTNVARDFYHFEPWVVPAGYIAFHDYADYYPGVKTFVNELLGTGRYHMVHHTRSMVVVRKRPEHELSDAEKWRIRPRREGAQLPHDTESAKPISVSATIAHRPLVSCLMPTADRRAFVPQAIQYFLRQDYPNRELIILDDGSDVVADLIPPDPRLRYVHLDAKHTIGAKLNLGCELAHGEIIAHWDDDDWMANWRLSYQVQELLVQPPGTLCGLAHLLFYDPRAVQAWEYIYPPAERAWLAGGTFCYRKDFWEQHQFPDLNEGADTVFVWNLTNTPVLALSEHTFYVATVHPHNTSPKRTHSLGWHPFPVEEIRRLLHEDWLFYKS